MREFDPRKREITIHQVFRGWAYPLSRGIELYEICVPRQASIWVRI